MTPNRLADELSPYLLQHANNPVDWYPWGPEALETARRENKPIFLSIGYSTCHWCHVMEHETFENPDAARVMNERYINIKVDREEQPDLDGIYMQASQALTGYGGWPLNMWLAPDTLAPYYSGGYMPPYAERGQPGFIRVLEFLSDQYRDQPERIAAAGEQMREAMRNHQGADPLEPSLNWVGWAATAARNTYDSLLGGFGRPPKFPPAMLLTLLTREVHRTGDTATLTMIEHTLTMMARGGMYDQIGGGFHRYSTDAQWLVPHFEKMLYDNALLAMAYTEAWQLTRNPLFKTIARETLDYVLRDLTSPEGAFYSAEDADSKPAGGGHQEEGLFYVWTPEEIRQVLGHDFPVEALLAYWDISP
ncbi:MAG: thioredoxin domain-containing protein, partial [bacterium]